MKVMLIPRQAAASYFQAARAYAALYNYTITWHPARCRGAAFVVVVERDVPGFVAAHQYVSAPMPEDLERWCIERIEAGVDREEEFVSEPEDFYLTWPSRYTRVTQRFGERPAYYAQFGLAGHDGVDIGCPGGSEVFAMAPGTVKEVNYHYNRPYGVNLRIESPGGYVHIYAHLRSIEVAKGEDVTRGQVVARSGNTGTSTTGAHLHIGLRKIGHGGLPGYGWDILNPEPYIIGAQW